MNIQNPIETFYTISAVIGGVLFLFRTIMALVGADADADVDFGGDIDISDVDGGIIDDSDLSSGGSFRLLSMHGITGFLLMFGLIGLSLVRIKLPVFITVLGGLFAGGITLVIVALIYYFMTKLQSDGTMKVQTSIGKIGTVYLTIPADGSGQVNIVVQGGLKQFDAISAKKVAIPTGDKIKVINILNGNILVVERVD